MNSQATCACMPKAFLMTSLRLLSGGALLLASLSKIQAPMKFMLSIKSFELVPESLIPFLAYAIIWSEIVAGIMLVHGLWTRAAALMGTVLYSVFTGGLLYVLVMKLPIDCGCFGGLFGGGTVDATSILRNSIFIVASLATLWSGGGPATLDAVFATRANCPRTAAESDAAPMAPSREQEA